MQCNLERPKLPGRGLRPPKPEQQNGNSGPWPLFWPCWQHGWTSTTAGRTEMEPRGSLLVPPKEILPPTISRAWVCETLFSRPCDWGPLPPAALLLVNCKCNEWKCTQIALNYMKVQNMQMTNNFITVLLKTQITFNYQSEMAHEVPRCVQVRPVLKTKYLY